MLILLAIVSSSYHGIIYNKNKIVHSHIFIHNRLTYMLAVVKHINLQGLMYFTNIACSMLQFFMNISGFSVLMVSIMNSDG